MPDASFCKLLAHDPGQWAHGGFGNIRHLKGGGVQLVAGAHAADDRRVHRHGPLHQRQLPRHSVDGIHNIVILRKVKGIRRLRGVENRIGSHLTVWIDVQHPPFARLHL